MGGGGRKRGGKEGWGGWDIGSFFRIEKICKCLGKKTEILKK